VIRLIFIGSNGKRRLRMADKLAELKAALGGMSDEGLRLVEEFAKFLLKQQSDQKRTKE
jgi:hypothetical protein